MQEREGTNRLNEAEIRSHSDSVELFKELTSIGVGMGMMNETVSYNDERRSPNIPQTDEYGNIVGQPQYYNYQPQTPAQSFDMSSTYDPMSEFDTTPIVKSPKYIVEQIGQGVNSRYNVKDSTTGQVYANCILPEASQKIAKLMNEGKMFSDIEVMKCLMADTRFNQSITEMRKVKATLDSCMNEAEKKTLSEKLQVMKEEALQIKQKI